MLTAKVRKNDEWFQHEGCDRTHTILRMIGELLGDYCSSDSYEENADSIHPSIWNEECGVLLEKTLESLAELYQKIGEWEDGRNED